MDVENKPALRVARALVAMMNAEAGHGDVLLVAPSECPATSSVPASTTHLKCLLIVNGTAFPGAQSCAAGQYARRRASF